MSNPWDHLPNAKHIDAIIASVEAHPEEWAAARTAARVAAWDAARNAVWNAAYSAACDAARNAEWNAAGGAAADAASSAASSAAYYAARGAAGDAIIALIAYDDCAYMIDSNPGELEILAKFGNEKAILLLPACNAFAAIRIHTPVIA
jgi:hypothetical protein